MASGCPLLTHLAFFPLQALGCKDGGELLSRLAPLHDQRKDLDEMQASAEAAVKEARLALSLSQTHLNEMRAGGKLTTQSQLDVVQVG